MRSYNDTKRTLRAESLESRQLLHGGGVGMLGAATVDEQVEAVFDRYDATEDGILSEADELSDRVTERLAAADGDTDGSVSMDELTRFYENARVSSLLGVADSGGRCRDTSGDVQERVDAAIEVIDEDGEGDLDQAEVSEELWEQIAAADTDANASLSSDELASFVETVDVERQAAFIADKVESVFAKYDADEDGSIVATEVSETRWERLSPADADANEAVSQAELRAYATEQVAAGESTRGLFGGSGHRGGGHHGRGGRGR